MLFFSKGILVSITDRFNDDKINSATKNNPWLQGIETYKYNYSFTESAVSNLKMALYSFLVSINNGLFVCVDQSLKFHLLIRNNVNFQLIIGELDILVSSQFFCYSSHLC
jgi:hypothetical protein